MSTPDEDGGTPMDPQAARQEYKELAAEAGRLLYAREDAQVRLAQAMEERTAAYAAVEAEEAHLDGLEERAKGIWRELTTRFGPRVGGYPEPADRVARGPDAEALLDEAHQRVREPVDHPLAGRYARMGMLGFAAALVITLLGLELTIALHQIGRVRLLAVAAPALAAPWLGYLAATGWIRFRLAHEEQEYAVDTAVAGALGGGGVWLIALAFVIIRVAS